MELNDFALGKKSNRNVFLLYILGITNIENRLIEVSITETEKNATP